MVTRPVSDALIIGAGVSGLTTAVCFAEAGLATRVIAEHLPLQTTSAAAAASWGPYMVTDPRALRWSEQARLDMGPEHVVCDGQGG